MRLEVRAILITTVSLAAWYLTDGIRAVLTGTLTATEVSATELLDAPGAVLLTDGRVIDYGAWAGVLLSRGIDPAHFGPLFIAIGLLGLIALFMLLLLERFRGLGWTLLLAFSVLSMVRLSLFAAIGALLLIALILPSTRRLVFGLKASDVGDVVVKDANGEPASDQADGAS